MIYCKLDRCSSNTTNDVLLNTVPPQYKSLVSFTWGSNFFLYIIPPPRYTFIPDLLFYGNDLKRFENPSSFCIKQSKGWSCKLSSLINVEATVAAASGFPLKCRAGVVICGPRAACLLGMPLPGVGALLCSDSELLVLHLPYLPHRAKQNYSC
jgi:hypothetical protein